MGTFAATVEQWVHDVEGALEAVFKEALQQLVSDMQAHVPIDTGFLRASLVASTANMPGLTRTKPDGSRFNYEPGPIELVIMGASPDDVIYLGYTANYGAYVHYGANGMPPRPWVSIAVQRWPTIVENKARQLKQRLDT